MSDDKRTAHREPLYAKMMFVEEKIPGYVRNISSTGIKAETPLPFFPQAGSRHTIEVIPIDIPGCASFSMTMEVRWIIPQPVFAVVGLSIESVSADGQACYQALLDFYNDQSSSAGNTSVFSLDP